jgi:hypothetical protein
MFVLKGIDSYADALRQFKEEGQATGLTDCPDDVVQYQLESIFIRGFGSGVSVALQSCMDEERLEALVKEIFDVQERMRAEFLRLRDQSKGASH